VRAPIGLFGQVPADSLTGNANDTAIVTGGTLTADTAIATAAQPWRVDGDVTVSTGAVLAAVPGASITAKRNELISFDLGGRLDARGTAGSPVLFTGGTDVFGGLRFRDTPSDTSFLTNAIVRSTFGYSFNCPLLVDGQSATHPVAIDSAAIKNSSCDGVRLAAAGSRISRTVVDSSMNVGISVGANTKIESVRVRRSDGSPGTGIVVTGPGVTIDQCEVSNSGSYGIFATTAATGLTVSNCNLLNNANVGIRYDAAGQANAISNWWGDPAGPTGPSGDGVSSNVTYVPFLTSLFVFTTPFP
jgi:hypothetical protein